jgi:DNA-binding beta-propeller fold protein YncE
VAVSPDGRYAFVSIEGVGGEPGTVDVFDIVAYEKVASAEIGKQAGGIAVWKTDGR